MAPEYFHEKSSLALHLNEPCGRIFCGPGWERTRENSLNLRDWELWLVWRGSGWMRTRAGSHPLFAGFCALMRPGGIYDAGQDETDPLGITFIHFDIERSCARVTTKGAATASGVQRTTRNNRAIRPKRSTASRERGALKQTATPLLRRIVPSHRQSLRIDAEPAQWPEFFLLDDIEYADLLTSRIIELLDNNLPGATALLHAFLLDLLEREPIAQQAWVEDLIEGDAADAARHQTLRAAGTGNDHRHGSLPHYRELRQLFARLRTTSPEALPSVAQMAAQTSLSPEHFSRLFRRVNGLSPMQFIISLRITHARHLLRESNLRVGEIAERLGYADVYFFSRQFKEQTGVSPLAYRR